MDFVSPLAQNKDTMNTDKTDLWNSGCAVTKLLDFVRHSKENVNLLFFLSVKERDSQEEHAIPHLRLCLLAILK